MKRNVQKRRAARGCMGIEADGRCANVADEEGWKWQVFFFLFFFYFLFLLLETDKAGRGACGRARSAFCIVVRRDAAGGSERNGTEGKRLSCPLVVTDADPFRRCV